MFLLNTDGAEVQNWGRSSSRASLRSWDTASTASCSADHHATNPDAAMLKALIRDLSFWDALPPASFNAFPSPLPKKPMKSQSHGSLRRDQPQFLLQRVKSASSEDFGRQQRRRSSNASMKGTISEHSNYYPQPVWKAAVDPTTGRTYYYDAVTRRTQWEKVCWM